MYSSDSKPEFKMSAKAKPFVSCFSKPWGDYDDNDEIAVPLPVQSKSKWKIIKNQPRKLQTIMEEGNDDDEISNELENLKINKGKYITSNIALVDSDIDNDLQLYHYTNCNSTSSEDVKSSRGIIRNNDKIVCKTFGFTEEYNVIDDIDKIKERLTSLNCKIYDAEEGATLRVYFFNNVWHISTHRKINAFKSKWGNPNSESFGQMFINALKWQVEEGDLKDKIVVENSEEIFNKYCSTLDENKIYTYLVRNSSDNRIVSHAPDHPTIYFIGSFDRSTFLLLEGNDSGINTCKQHSFENIDEVLSYVDKVDYTRKQGLIVYLNNQQQFKILNSEYLKNFKARGNEPSIKFRYLQIRTDSSMVALLYSLYPECIVDFENYERILNIVGGKIYKSYIDRFINHKHVVLPKPEYIVMEKAHEWHCQNRKENKISLDKILDIIDSLSGTSLNRIIKLNIKNERQEIIN